MKFWFAAGLLLAGVDPAQAATVFVDFDAVSHGATVDEFYNGGFDGAGARGPKLLLRFSNFLTTSGFGEISEPHLAYNIGTVATVSFVPGFSRVELAYGAFGAGSLAAFAQPDGTGAELARLDLAVNNPYAFSPAAFQFAGEAQSLVLSAGFAQIGIDNLRLTNAITSPLPESGSWALMLAGFGLAGVAIRGRRPLTGVA
jgi:hypothetical protein